MYPTSLTSFERYISALDIWRVRKEIRRTETVQKLGELVAEVLIAADRKKRRRRRGRTGLEPSLLQTKRGRIELE